MKNITSRFFIMMFLAQPLLALEINQKYFDQPSNLLFETFESKDNLMFLQENPVTIAAENFPAKWSLTQQVGSIQKPFKVFFVPYHPDSLIIKTNRGEAITYENIDLKINEEKPCRCHHFHQKHSTRPHDQSLVKENFLVRAEFIGNFGQVPITRLIVSPIQYDEASKRISYYKSLSLDVRHKDGRSLIFSENLPGLVEKQIIKNKLNDTFKNKELLIIGPGEWEKSESVVNFQNHKRKFGIKSYYLNRDEWGKTAEEIKTHLEEFLMNHKNQFGYVLFLGHEESFPTFYLPTTNSSETPSDLPYFTEIDHGDFIPEIYTGRIIADSEEDLKNNFAKIIQRENTPMEKNQSIGIASSEGSNPSDVEYLQSMENPLKLKWQMDFKHFLQMNPDAIPQNINMALGEGASIVHYLGHGSGYSWESLYQSSYNASDVKNSTQHQNSKGVIYPVVIDVSCQNGRFLHDGHLGERFMNESTNEGPLGASAYYGGSVDISWDPPALMAQSMSERAIEQNTSPHPLRLGEVLWRGQMDLYNKIDDLTSIQDNMVWYHLLGDPSMIFNLGPEVKKNPNPEPPASMGRYRMTTSGKFIRLYGPDNNPLPKQLVTLQKGSFILKIWTDSNGRFKIPLLYHGAILRLKVGGQIVLKAKIP
jgi:hypothetical protein